MKTRPPLSQQVRTFGPLACGLMVAVIGAGPTRAASSDAPQSVSSQTVFVDLTTQRAVASEPAGSDRNLAAPASSTGTTFIDLTTGAAPSAMPNRNIATPPKTPHVRKIDLTNGASPPAVEDVEEDVPVPETTVITITADRLKDPYEETNRGRFKSHVALHHYVIDPVERAYIYVVPELGRAGVHNFLTNLETPSILANDVFQGKVDRAGNTLSRFVVNSTLGIFGIFDVAGRAGIRFRDDDFGATLATYGVGDSPYLLIPVIGPSNPRDLSGKVVDIFLNPLRYFTLPGGIFTSIGNTGLHEVDKRTEEVGELDELSRSTPDPYAAERSKALERRREEIDDTPTSSIPADSFAVRAR
ncbi:MAG TPA: VacJ family lipoprotein [Micropepsaceae bacterium]|nr:VacJ family lipoprotein [Micropepsaceae bacterium]